MKKARTGSGATMSNEPKRNTINTLIEFPILIRSVAVHKKYEATLPAPLYPVVAPDELVGIEIEVENIPYPHQFQYYWKGKQDGSLRNHGIEYTSIPLRTEQVEYALDHWNKYIKENNNPTFSQRTSLHVHLNVQNMTWDEIENLVLLYVIFERHFFLQTNQDREHSIFCVPLYKVDNLCNLLPIQQVSPRWNKYAALNLSTITGEGESPRFGTIEFRHLHGTSNPAEIVPWINNIMRLKKQAMAMESGSVIKLLETMNTTSEYLALYTQTFGEQARPQAMQKADFEYCITMAKLGLFGKLHEHAGSTTISTVWKKYTKLRKKPKPFATLKQAATAQATYDDEEEDHNPDEEPYDPLWAPPPPNLNNIPAADLIAMLATNHQQANQPQPNPWFGTNTNPPPGAI